MEEAAQPKKGNLLEFFARNPLFGLAGTIASLVGIPLAIILFSMSQREREICYAVSPNVTTIVRAGKSSDLKVHFKNQEVTSDVSSVQVVIWNAGKESVRHGNILSEHISLKFSPAVPILDAIVARTTRDIIGFQLDTSESANGILHMSWNILEFGDGAVIEFIYAGVPKHLVVDGEIEGEHPIRRVYRDQRRQGFTRVELTGIGFGALLISVVAAVRHYRKRMRATGIGPLYSEVAAIVTTVAAVSILILFVIVAEYLSFTQPAVPLSFF